jgi:hypothetical protein
MAKKATETAGYSGTPLAKKLGIKPEHTVAVINEPPEFRQLLADLPDGVTFRADVDGKPDVVVAFYTEQTKLESALDELADAVFPDRMIWLAWPKKTAKVETDLTGDVVRATVLATKLVDVKVCAISEVWSGLKVVWRKEARAAPAAPAARSAR